MTRKRILWAGLGAVALALAGFAAWILSLPPAPAAVAPPPIAEEETRAALAALKPPKRERPLIAIVGINDATEVTDYVVPYGILRRAGVADVMALATAPGPVQLFPALRIQPDATVAEFDARHPEGADYVIVPAMSRDDDPAALQWIRSQAAKGATVVGICAGAMVVGAAGLLDGKRATTHWYYVGDLRRAHPTAVYVPDRRLVVDKGVATTTGITASMPMMFTLIEAIAGRARADAAARDLGLAAWDTRHDSAAFKLARPFAVTVMRNVLAFWNRDEFGLELSPGVDEVSLALVADAWSRTYRSRALTFAGSAEPVATRNGLRVVPDRATSDWLGQRLPAIDERPPAKALDNALSAIEARYGRRTADVVAVQLEYPRPGGSRPEPRTQGPYRVRPNAAVRMAAIWPRVVGASGQ
jgi:transcriptional regulator GlxA family with amidase domain